MARPMTMAEKILAAHAGLDEVEPGQLIECDLDLVLANDVTVAYRHQGSFKQDRRGAGVRSRTGMALVPDHYVPEQGHQKRRSRPSSVRDFAREQGITHYYEVGLAWASSTRCCPSRAWWARAI